ncbi:MAG: hypothetical protein BWZ10_03241 [candidate division BRC1 bacterium ADurb.BinA364]|nr:MAG: hypothetical protein BWZ10_03241 [candidate division BRC1 bacterium ADurb.BinA364]
MMAPLAAAVFRIHGEQQTDVQRFSNHIDNRPNAFADFGVACDYAAAGPGPGHSQRDFSIFVQLQIALRCSEANRLLQDAMPGHAVAMALRIVQPQKGDLVMGIEDTMVENAMVAHFREFGERGAEQALPVARDKRADAIGVVQHDIQRRGQAKSALLDSIAEQLRGCAQFALRLAAHDRRLRVERQNRRQRDQRRQRSGQGRQNSIAQTFSRRGNGGGWSRFRILLRIKRQGRRRWFHERKRTSAMPDLPSRPGSASERAPQSLQP